jgi:nitric oxide reductase NorE protein
MTGSTKDRVPGEEGIWVLVIGDLFIFSIFFLVFSYARAGAPDVFSAGHLVVDRQLGLLNTFLLLTSSLFVAIGVNRIIEQRGSAKRLFDLAIVCGIGFVVVKLFEYNAKIDAGYTPASNDFFMYYFIFTGIHLLHVVIGLLVLFFMREAAKSGDIPDGKVSAIECGGIFWHLVDLLWIVLFALFYILGG